MDTKFLLMCWGVAIVAAIVAGGPVLVVVGMFVAWLMPAIIVGAIILVALIAIGRAWDQQNRQP